MSNIDFQSIFNTLKTGVIQLAGTTARNYVDHAKNDGLALLNGMKDDLARWTEQMKDGLMSTAELEDLVKGQITDIKLAALKQAGITAIELDKFKKGLVDLISKTISTVI